MVNATVTKRVRDDAIRSIRFAAALFAHNLSEVGERGLRYDEDALHKLADLFDRAEALLRQSPLHLSADRSPAFAAFLSATLTKPKRTKGVRQ